MKKASILLAGILLLTIVLQAQKKQSRFLTELAIGPSFPIGRFAETKYEKDGEVPGFAKPGLGVNLSVGYYLNKSIGLLLSAGYAEHPQDEQAYGDMYRRMGYSVSQIDGKNWKGVKLMAGGFVAVPLAAKGKLALLTKLTAGVSKTAVPKISWSGYHYSSPTPISTEQGKISLPWSFCYQVSVGLQYKISRNLHVLLDISSFNTKATHKFSYTVYSMPPGPGSIGRTRTVENKYKLGTVNAMAGVGFQF